MKTQQTAQQTAQQKKAHAGRNQSTKPGEAVIITDLIAELRKGGYTGYISHRAIK